MNTVAPLFDANLVQTGPVLRKGYLSQVTAGPKTGFGLMSERRRDRLLQQAAVHERDAGVGFPEPHRGRPAGPASRQALPVQRDDLRLGRADHHHRACAARGFRSAPSYTHTIDAAITSVPTEGHGTGPRDRRSDRHGPGCASTRRSTKARSASSASRSRKRHSRKLRSESPARRPSGMPILRAKGLVGNDTLAVE